jgi:hypothetical protein
MARRVLSFRKSESGSSSTSTVSLPLIHFRTGPCFLVEGAGYEGRGRRREVGVLVGLGVAAG